MRILGRRFSTAEVISFVLLAIGAVAVLYPFFYMLMNSVKPGREILHNATALPSEITFSGFVGVVDRLNILRLFRNSIFLAASVTILNTSLSALAAYAFAKISFPGRQRLFSFMLATMMIPGILFLIPTYVLIYNLGWVGRFESLIVPSAVTVYNIFLMRQFMLTIPNEVIESARLDGAGELQVFRHIIVPLARPALATVAILNFMASWNDFFGPLLYLNQPENWTLQLGLQQFKGTVPGENIQEVWAATTLITLPLVIVYFFLQEEFVKAFANVSIEK